MSNSSKSVFKGVSGSRLIKSSVYSVIGQLAVLVSPLIMMPMMLEYLGDVEFGLWVTFVSTTGILIFLDFGTGNALVTKLSKALSVDDYSCVRNLIAGALKIYISIFLIGSLCSVILVALLARFLDDPSYFLVGIPVLLFFFANYPAGIIYRIFHAQQRMLSFNVLLVLSQIIAVISCISAISFGAPKWVVISFFSGIPVLINIFVLLVEMYFNSDFRIEVKDLTSANIGGLLSLASGFFVLSMLINIGMNSDILIISILLGSEAAANAAIPIKIGMVMLALNSYAYLPLWSMYADSLAKHDYASVRKFSLAAAIVGFTCFLLLGGFGVYFIDEIIYLWMDTSFLGQEYILIAMTGLACVAAATGPYSMILNAQGLVVSQIVPWVAFVIVTLGAKFFFLSPGNSWYAPAISAVAYFTIVLPLIVFNARRSLSSR